MRDFAIAVLLYIGLNIGVVAAIGTPMVIIGTNEFFGIGPLNLKAVGTRRNSGGRVYLHITSRARAGEANHAVYHIAVSASHRGA